MKVTSIILSTLLMAMPEAFAARGSRKLMGSGGSKKGKGEGGDLIECPEPAIGQLFSSSNAADGNELLAFCRYEDGSLTFAGSLPTEGIGGSAGGGLDEDGNPNIGTVFDPLGSNHPVVLHNDRCVLATNAGSDSVSTFMADRHDNSVHFVGEFHSYGSFPVSIATSSRGTVFVLNAGGEGSVMTFFIEEDCSLSPIDEPRILSFDEMTPPFFATSPGAIRVHPSETSLILTQKGTLQSLIVVFPFDETGLLKSAIYTQSEGYQPFSTAFDPQGNLLIVEENGLAALPPTVEEPPPRSGAVSTYALNNLGGLEPISSSVPTNQTAPCWSVYTSQCLFVANVVSGTIGSFLVNSDGSVTLLDDVAAVVDVALDLFVIGDYLYALSALERIVPTPEVGPRTRPTPSIYTFKLQPDSCGLELVGRSFDGFPSIDATGGNGVTGLEGF